jgi:8-oxo-dGTP pyrophosphatase MutT (NUDIX family)
MNDYFAKVQGFLLDLDYNILSENEEDGVFWVDNEEAGIHNLVMVAWTRYWYWSNFSLKSKKIAKRCTNNC